MFEAEQVSISIGTVTGSPEVTNTFTLDKGQRHTLLVPSDITNEWMLVSLRHRIMKTKTHTKAFNG